MLKLLGLAIVMGGGFLAYSASTAPSACAAGLGCCMERADEDKAPWVQISDKPGIKQCKALNRKKDGGKDKILKPEGKIMWSIKC